MENQASASNSDWPSFNRTFSEVLASIQSQWEAAFHEMTTRWVYNALAILKSMASADPTSLGQTSGGKVSGLLQHMGEMKEPVLKGLSNIERLYLAISQEYFSPKSTQVQADDRIDGSAKNRLDSKLKSLSANKKGKSLSQDSHSCKGRAKKVSVFASAKQSNSKECRVFDVSKFLKSSMSSCSAGFRTLNSWSKGKGNWEMKNSQLRQGWGRQVGQQKKEQKKEESVVAGLHPQQEAKPHPSIQHQPNEEAVISVIKNQSLQQEQRGIENVRNFANTKKSRQPPKDANKVQVEQIIYGPQIKQQLNTVEKTREKSILEGKSLEKNKSMSILKESRAPVKSRNQPRIKRNNVQPSKDSPCEQVEVIQLQQEGQAKALQSLPEQPKQSLQKQPKQTGQAQILYSVKEEATSDLLWSEKEDLAQFIDIGQKIILPITRPFLSLFSARMKELALKYRSDFPLEERIGKTEKIEDQKEFLRQSLRKMSKLLTLVCPAEKKEKILLYISKCLVCVDTIYFHGEQSLLEEDLVRSIGNLLAKINSKP